MPLPCHSTRYARGTLGSVAQHGDEYLSTLDLAGRRVDHLHGVTGEVDEQPFACDVDLAQRGLQPPGPLAIQIAKPAPAHPASHTLVGRSA